MSWQLLSLGEGPDIPIDKPILLFGRHDECDVQVHSRKISRRHCCLAVVSDYLVVRDLGSTNGIRINGQRVREGRLRLGDELQIANLKYQLTKTPLSQDMISAAPSQVPPSKPEDDDLNDLRGSD